MLIFEEQFSVELLLQTDAHCLHTSQCGINVLFDLYNTVKKCTF